MRGDLVLPLSLALSHKGRGDRCCFFHEGRAFLAFERFGCDVESSGEPFLGDGLGGFRHPGVDGVVVLAASL